MTAESSLGSGDRRQWAHGERREGIIQAAIRVVAQGGLGRITYRSVAEEAGVAHGLVRHHFGSIDALVEEALQVCITRTVTTIGLNPGSGNPEDFARGIVESLQRDPDTQFFQYEVLLESRRTESLRESVDKMMAHYRSVVREGLQRMGLSADHELVEFVYATVEGIVLQQSVRGLATEAEEAVTVLRQVLTLLKREQKTGSNRPR
ncbi:MAG: TetR family transcriptional regulator [Rhodococcus sp.]|nr:TetR family transcriptional regulator [Rhodococcus sp. (in: high G+C Gram-positive bacteria)]MBJ7324376.1 TetR family transcriptional regulator [Rhodococcus sp. (in: high G+C Gram-positive bacteria)]